MLHSLPSSPKFDAAEAVFVERALLWVETELYNTEFPPMEGRKYVPVDNTTPAGAKFTAYRQFTRTGLARLVTEKGQDLPNAGLFVKEFFHQFYPVGASYQYDYLDLLAAGLSSQNGGPPLNLDLELATAAYEAIEKKLDLIASVGSGAAGSSYAIEDEADVGMLGLNNLPNATIYVVPNGISGSQAWSTKTPDEIVADLTGITAGIISTTGKTFVPDTLLTPIAQYESIGGRSMGDGRSDTVLSYFLKTNKHIKEMDSWLYLAGAGSSTSDRMVCYKKDKRYVRHMIAMEFTQLPPEFKGMTTKVNCIAKTAGVVSPYPLSVSYGDHI